MIDFFYRLDKFMKYKGLNDNKITVDAGISNGIIGKARKRGSLSLENIAKILLKYPELDANWLLTGKGEMLSENNHVSEPGVSYNATCLRCKDKDTIISLLNEKIASLEKESVKGSDSQNAPYSQTG